MILKVEGINEYVMAQPWMIGVLLFSLALLAFVRYSYPRIQLLYFKSIVSNSLPRDFMDEDKVLSHRAALVLLFNAGIFIALLVTVFSNHQSTNSVIATDFVSFIIVFLSILVIFVLKTLFQTGFKIIFNGEFGIKEYILNNSFINMFLGILLIPLALIAIFTSKEHLPLLLNVTITLISIAQLLKILKGSLIAIKYRVNLLYFILYLCAFEIIPVLILVKEVILKAY